MRPKTITALIFTICCIAAGCIKQIDVQTRYEKPVLVVEGNITTDSVPYKVKLTYTRPVSTGNKIPDEYLVKDAVVTIADELGNTARLVHIGDGNYETSDSTYVGKVGRSYHVTVELKDGKKYISSPEKILPPVPIDKVTVLFDPIFDMFLPPKLVMYIDVNDPPNQENYYNWVFESYLPRKTLGVSCGTLCIYGEYCFQGITNSGLQVYSDAASNGNKIINRQIGISPIYWYGNHYVDIMQHSISREEYQFSVKYNEQQTRTGSILDPLPASIKGNVYNNADHTDFALGYFSASSVTHKKLVVIPFNISQYQLEISALIYIPPGPHICFEYFPNSIYYPLPPARQNPPPPGWEHADTLEVHW